MSKPETIRIDEVEYVRKDSMDNPMKYAGDIKIVIADRGFVFVGHLDTKSVPDMVVLSKASNIRIWGTKNGIGELVGGPTSSTKLDKVGTIRISMRAVIAVIDVEQSKWKLL